MGRQRFACKIAKALLNISSKQVLLSLKRRADRLLVGFLSQSHSDEAYIHFVGVHPDHRKLKIGKILYQAFYEAAEKEGRTTIKAVTAPINKVSIAYHTKLGFQIEKGDKTVDGISVFSDYDGIHEDRVLFVKKLEAMK